MILDRIRWPRVAVCLAGFCIAAGCAQHASVATVSTTSPTKPLVVATTTTMAYFVRSVGGELVRVETIVPLGASPETYEPRPQDLVMVSHAALVVQNGAGLEAWLGKVLANSMRPGTKILTLSDGVPAHEFPAGSRITNPHFWLDPVYAQLYVREIATAVQGIDPVHAATYQRNAAAEIARIQQLDTWIRSRIAQLPASDRAMITFHDAWYYFDRRYGIRDLGSVVSSPGKEPSAAQFAALIAKAKAAHMHAIFGEPEYSPRLVQQLADSAGIRTVTNLYDDSLGTTPSLSSYEGIMHYDVDTIVNALHG